MSLTILNVAYPMAPVGADAVGGAEQVLTRLDAGLVRARHNSIVIACHGSKAEGVLVPTPHWTAPFDEATRHKAVQCHRTAISQSLHAYPIDLVHLHGVYFHQYLPSSPIPVLVTLH